MFFDKYDEKGIENGKVFLSGAIILVNGISCDWSICRNIVNRQSDCKGELTNKNFVHFCFIFRETMSILVNLNKTDNQIQVAFSSFRKSNYKLGNLGTFRLLDNLVKDGTYKYFLSLTYRKEDICRYLSTGSENIFNQNLYRGDRYFEENKCWIFQLRIPIKLDRFLMILNPNPTQYNLIKRWGPNYYPSKSFLFHELQGLPWSISCVQNTWHVVLKQLVLLTNYWIWLKWDINKWDA